MLNHTESENPSVVSSWGFGFYLLGFVLIIGGFIFFQSNRFVLRHVELSGNKRLAKEEILDRVGLSPQINLLQLDIEQLRQVLLEVTSIRQVTIERKFPDTLRINIVEREPICLVESPKGLLEIDQDGVILSTGRPEAMGTLPVMKGLNGLQLVPGSPGRLHHALFPQGVKLLIAAGTDLRREILEIDMTHFRIYTLDSIQVEIGDLTRLQQKMATLRALLAGSNRRKIRRIDIRVPSQPALQLENLSGAEDLYQYP